MIEIEKNLISENQYSKGLNNNNPYKSEDKQNDD